MIFDLTRLPDDFIDNPHPHYAALRERDPVYEMPGGGLFLSRHADLVRVYKDRKTFSSDKKIEFYNIQAGGTIHMVLQLRGGAR